MPNRYWLMWGWIDPKKRPPPRLVVKRQGVYSETNYNLLLDLDPGRESSPRDFGLGQLVAALGGTLPYGPGRLLEEGRFAPDEPVVALEHGRLNERIALGPQFLMPTEDAIVVAEELARRWELPKWRFTISATTANTEAIKTTGANGLRDMGKCMAALKARYAASVVGARAPLIAFNVYLNGSADHAKELRSS